MTIAFTCPHCGQQTNVADRFAGQSGPCSSCGQTVTVPTIPSSHDVVRLPQQRRRTWLEFLVIPLACLLFFVCAGLPMLLVPNMQGTWDSQRRSACRANLEQIATAVSLYEADHGCFPPPFTNDADGNRLHSWRTLLLPYLGEEALHECLELDEPWDSESNRLWHGTPVDVYQCPADSSGSATDTSYVVIVGGEGVYDDGKTRKAVEITDGVTATILIAEVTGSGIHWMEPEDLHWEEMDFTINGAMSISSEHEGGAHVMMCDGLVEFLGDAKSPAEVRALATRAGGEPVPEVLGYSEEDFSD